MTDMAEFYHGDRPTLNVETYDVRTPDAGVLQHDLAFFIEYARAAGGPVLELGSGTGRVTVRLAEAGVDAVGLERSAAMLRYAEAKRAALPSDVRGRLRFVPGDMSDFALGERFALVIAPFRAWMALVTPEAQRRSLACVRRHLVPGGRFIVDLFDPLLHLLRPGAIPSPTPPRMVRHPVSGTRVTIEALERVNDPLTQVFSEVWRFTESDDTCAVLRQEDERLTMRWTYRYEMRHLLELAGFTVEHEFSAFDRSPPAYGKEQIWVTRADRDPEA